jgi:hypothetical protein
MNADKTNHPDITQISQIKQKEEEPIMECGDYSPPSKALTSQRTPNLLLEPVAILGRSHEPFDHVA